MKILIILFIVLGIFAIYFVFSTDRLTSAKNTNIVTPAGIDVAKFLLNRSLNQIRKINPNEIIKNNGVLQSKLTEDLKSKIGDIGNEIFIQAAKLIKKPIENKAREYICPLK